jgi:bacterioferritin-associated ferredoxin
MDTHIPGTIFSLIHTVQGVAEFAGIEAACASIIAVGSAE